MASTDDEKDRSVSEEEEEEEEEEEGAAAKEDTTNCWGSVALPAAAAMMLEPAAEASGEGDGGRRGGGVANVGGGAGSTWGAAAEVAGVAGIPPPKWLRPVPAPGDASAACGWADTKAGVGSSAARSSSSPCAGLDNRRLREGSGVLGRLACASATSSPCTLPLLPRRAAPAAACPSPAASAVSESKRAVLWPGTIRF
jgi:hypothetical protein